MKGISYIVSFSVCYGIAVNCQPTLTGKTLEPRNASPAAVFGNWWNRLFGDDDIDSNTAADELTNDPEERQWNRAGMAEYWTLNPGEEVVLGRPPRSETSLNARRIVYVPRDQSVQPIDKLTGFEMYESMVWFPEGSVVLYPEETDWRPYRRGMPLPQDTRVRVGPVQDIM